MMNQKSRGGNVLLFRLLIVTPLLLVIGVGVYIVFSRETIVYGEFIFSDDLPPIRVVEPSNSGLNIFSTGNQREVYALHATTKKTEDFSFFDHDGTIALNNNLNLTVAEETVYVIFENALGNTREFGEQPPKRETFILKVFYEFEEIEFSVGNQLSFHTEFLFNLSEGYQVHIPIQLPAVVTTNNQWGNLTIAIFATPQYNTVNHLAQWYHYCADCAKKEFSLSSHGTGIVANFALSVGEKDAFLHYQEQYVEKTDLILSVNPEFLADDFEDILTELPPSPWIVSPGETVKIGFAIHNSDYYSPIEINDFVIIGLLNWDQIKLNGMSYFWESSKIHVNETKEGYFVINAPNEPGYYDFVAIAVGNPNEVNHFQASAVALRFTIKVA
jgi:hypothetical protein